MPGYRVYLEIAADGRTMAHVPELPGCMVLASNRDAALQQLPQAVRECWAWLRRHGEPAPPEEEEIALEVAGESVGYGPFASGDAAALFPPDELAVTPEEVELYLRRMAYSREDLLSLAGDLPEETLDFRLSSQARSVREILRHIGRAETWYVSRLIPPERLPEEWDHAEELPLYEFLAMERRTAVACLRGLSERERAEVFHPSYWTQHPEEPWTARKVLRRFLEHEREHTVEIRSVLGFRRRQFLAQLAAARAGLLASLLHLDEETLLRSIVSGEWTARDILVHLIGWDAWALEQMRRMVLGEVPDLSPVADQDACNAAVVAAWRDRTLEDVLSELHRVRAVWVQWMGEVPEEAFFRRRPIGGEDWHFPGWIEVFTRHEQIHTGELADWKKSQGETATGPKALLAAALVAARAELLAAAELVSPEERTTRPVCGVWTLKDVFGHIADWEAYLLSGLQDMAAGRAPQVEDVPDLEAWNQAHARARRDQPWEAVWSDFQSVHQALMELLGQMEQGEIERTFPGVWEAQTRPYAWFALVLEHDREHAADVRRALSA